MGTLRNVPALHARRVSPKLLPFLLDHTSDEMELSIGGGSFYVQETQSRIILSSEYPATALKYASVYTRAPQVKDLNAHCSGAEHSRGEKSEKSEKTRQNFGPTNEHRARAANKELEYPKAHVRVA